MWRHVGKGVSSKLKLCQNSISYSHCVTSANKLGPVPAPGPNSIIAERAMIDGYGRIGGTSVRNDEFDQNCFLNSLRLFSRGSSLGHYFRGYASAAEAIVSSTDGEDNGSGFDEMREAKVYRKGFIGKERKFQPKLIRGMGPGTYHRLHQRQVQMETESWKNAAKEYKELLVDMCDRKLAPNLPYVKTLFLGWFEPLRDEILKEQDLCKLGKNKTYGPFFDVLPADMMAVITMHKLMGLLMTGGGQGGIKVVEAAHQIGEGIENEARIQMFLLKTKKKNVSNKKLEDEVDLDKKLEGEIDSETLEQGKTVQKMRKTVEKLLKKHKVRAVTKIVKSYDDSKPWGQDNQLKVGSRLIQLMIQTAYIQPPVDQSGRVSPDIRPAFMHTLKSITKENQKFTRSYGVIECDPLVRKGLEKSASHMVIPYMPMLVPPLKWNGYKKGAYLFLPSHIMRTHGAKQQRVAIKMAPRKKLEPVFEALDTLGNTKWKVNKRVLAVMDRIWASGGSIAGMVDREDVPLPEKPDTEDEAEQKKWRWKCKDVKKENSERHSQRCDTELKLVVARNMKDEDGFYYPHNLDFRGCAYPMHPYLNHLGSDLCRGILEFAEGRPLGKSGLRWLKIHLANVFAAGGVDKLSYDGRVAFTEEHVEDIYDSADRPLEGRRWWLSAEDPFQCLGTCMNLAEALRSPSPETAISYVPVHQDGSCNGLQHYAALGRDKLGAVAVNLVAGEKPADVYSGIAERVLDILKHDSQQDPSVEPNALRAKILINQVNRKLVKQTVMTSVYGVTYIGARDQIKRRLKERCVFDDDNELFASAGYIARITLTALGEMFESAKSIMSWLGDCAKVIASENHDVRWTTPLGLPVVQPYRKLERHAVKTSLQALSVTRETEKVMVRRQRTAFPPNFVHSLDGSHMMMTAVACRRAGLNFAGVHDSYWTHACDVHQMNKILREKFVELYNQPILENLLENFQTHPGLRFPPIPERGDFDLKEVLESPYFFN